MLPAESFSSEENLAIASKLYISPPSNYPSQLLMYLRNVFQFSHDFILFQSSYSPWNNSLSISLSISGSPDSSIGKEFTCSAGDSRFLGQEIHWRRDRLPSWVFLDFPCGSAAKESACCNVGDLGLIPGLGISPGEGKDYALQYSGLENSMDCIVHGVAKSPTWLSEFHFHFTFKSSIMFRKL